MIVNGKHYKDVLHIYGINRSKIHSVFIDQKEGMIRYLDNFGTDTFELVR